MPRRGSSKPPAEPVVKPYGCDCSASRPSIESETKEDTIEPGTETLSITADPRSDGLVKARTGDTTDKVSYDDWYKNVYVSPVPASE